jgi:chitin synthase
MKETDAFGKDVGLTKVKGYMVFILAFTAITNSVVCHTFSAFNAGS